MKEFFKKILKTFKEQCPATKILLLIGIFCLINTSITVFFTKYNSTATDIAIRSTMSSIFGYIFGEHCLPNKFGNKGMQIIVAAFTSFICLLVLIILHWCSLEKGISSDAEIRNLLSSSVGFLISKAKNQEEEDC